MHVRLGDGNGRFTGVITSVHYSAHGIDKMLTADFNRDNKLDLACISTSYRYLLVLLGNGDGTFVDKPMRYVGRGDPFSDVATADFNDDGHLDIIVTIAKENAFYILLGDGTGNFPIRIKTDTGINSYPTSIATADFNRDGYEEVVVLNVYARQVGIYFGHGNGSFRAQQTYFTGGNYDPLFLNIGDFNNDALPDVVIAYSTANFIGMLLSSIDGALVNIRRHYISEDTPSIYLMIADMDNDHFSDIITSNSLGGDVLFADGLGNFRLKQILAGRKPSLESPRLAVGDLNGDGYDDIIYVHPFEEFQTIFLNTCPA